VFRAARVFAGTGLVLLLVLAAGPIAAQPAKKVLTFADNDVWRNGTAPLLSPDGTYAVFSITSNEGDGESIIRHIATGKETKFPRGAGGAFALANPKFTPDGKRVLLPLSPTKAETDKAKAEKKADAVPQSSLAVVNLATGTVVEKFPQSGAFYVGGEGAGFVVYRKPTRPEPGKGDGAKTETPTGPMGGKGTGGKGIGGKFPGKGGGLPTAPPPSGGESYGTDLLVRDLATKTDRTLADVSQFSLSKDGQLLVYSVASRKDETNGVYAVNPRSGASASAIKIGQGRYSGLTWDDKQTKLAFLYDDSAVRPANEAPPPRPAGVAVGTAGPSSAPPVPPKWRVFVWDRSAKALTPSIARTPVVATTGFASLVSVGLAAHQPTLPAPADEVLGPSTPGLREGWTFNGGSLNFSPDGTKLFVNTAPKRAPAAGAPPGPPRTDDFQLDLWHWKDERLQPAQKLQATADQARTYSAVVLLDSKQFRQLSDETMTVSQPPSGSDWALGSDNRKYRHAIGY
jgi:hypothetical protein